MMWLKLSFHIKPCIMLVQLNSLCWRQRDCEPGLCLFWPVEEDVKTWGPALAEVQISDVIRFLSAIICMTVMSCKYHDRSILLCQNINTEFKPRTWKTKLNTHLTSCLLTSRPWKAPRNQRECFFYLFILFYFFIYFLWSPQRFSCAAAGYQAAY